MKRLFGQEALFQGQVLAGCHGHQVPWQIVFGASLVNKPALGRACQQRGFLGGEGLALHHEQGRARVQPLERMPQTPSVDIGDKMYPSVSAGALIQALKGLHAGHGPKGRAADAQIDHIGERLTAKALELMGFKEIDKAANTRQFCANLRLYRLSPRRVLEALASKGHVKGRTLLAHIDPLASKERLGVLLELGALCQFGQGHHHLSRYPLV